MKIAIASDNQRDISAHFGRTLGFVIYTVENKKIVTREYRPNNFTGHATHSEGHHNMHHTHNSIIEALRDCEVVISNGMGRRLYEDLISANIRPVITTETNVENALTLYLEGKLQDNPETCCPHHSH